MVDGGDGAEDKAADTIQVSGRPENCDKVKTILEYRKILVSIQFYYRHAKHLRHTYQLKKILKSLMNFTVL